MNNAIVSVILLLGLGAGRGARSSPPLSQHIWWEAETPKSTNFPRTNPFSPSDERTARVLSNGKWIGASQPGKVLFLEYQIAVEQAGTYRFYARKYWRHGPFKWRFDSQPWRTCGDDVALLDNVSMSKDVVVNWVDLGWVKLHAGARTLRIELSEATETVAFDCFLLTTGPFVARGKLRPGETYEVAPKGWFTFDPDFDSFGGTALDLRGLNERFAGEGGFIQARGDSFVHEKTAQPVRFWAVNTGHDLLAYDRAALDRFARHLAKIGVNMLRLQGPLWRADDVTRIDETKLVQIHRLVAALKSQGIYLTLSSFWPLWLHPKGLRAFEGIRNDMNSFALPFFNPGLQEIQRSWWKQALTAINPETGLTLLQDPTLAFIEILNEDGMFFWTFSPYKNVPSQQMEILEKIFGQWLTTRYGSIEQAFAKWSGGRILAMLGRGRVKGDAATDGRAGLMPLGDILNRRNDRAQDTVEFLAGLQRRYYDQLYRYLKTDLGFKGSITGSNWITAEARVFGPLDKWSNAGCDFMDRHGYYGGPHEGDRASYMLSNGDRFNDASALLFETGKNGEVSFDLPLMDLIYNDKPSSVSEINWVPPNRFRADMPVLSAVYGALQGSDAFFFFAIRELAWPQALAKFSISDPVAMGQFPATALIFRKGLVKTAGVALHVEAKLSDLYALKGIPISAPQNLDGFGKQDLPSGKPLETDAVVSMDPLAFLAGRVEVNVTEKGGTSKVADLSNLIDRDKKKVRSMTGELLWDYGHGLATIDAPAAQGATGFLANAGAIGLGDVKIVSGMEYGSLLLVAMDDQPIKTSRKLLLQVMSEDNNTGWSAPGKGLRTIVDVGGPPIVVKNFEGKVSLKRADTASLRVTPLDFNGYPSPAATHIQRAQGVLDITLLPSTMYYMIEK